ncbi:MAG: DNA polymerase III subunit gamma/tau [Bacteroidota bacterium]
MLYHFRWRKKKVDFIIPPTYYRRQDYSIVESQKSKIETIPETKIEIVEEITIDITPNNDVIIEETKTIIQTTNQPTSTQPKVSSLSLASIKAKKELLEAQKGIVKEVVHLPSESFTETEMQEFWFKYADRLGDKGYKIMESLLRINDPKLNGTIIVHELPNESSKIDFEKEKHDLLTYLRSHLHNHEISIDVQINESIDSKKAFTAQDKYNRLNEINPNLEVLKKLFDLDI